MGYLTLTGSKTDYKLLQAKPSKIKMNIQYIITLN